MKMLHDTSFVATGKKFQTLEKQKLDRKQAHLIFLKPWEYRPL